MEYNKLELKYDNDILIIDLMSSDKKILKNQLKSLIKYINKQQCVCFINLEDFFICDTYYVTNRNLFSIRIIDKINKPLLPPLPPKPIKNTSNKKRI